MNRAQKIGLAVWAFGFVILAIGVYVASTSPTYEIDYSNIVVKGCEDYKVYGNKLVIFDNGDVYTFELPIAMMVDEDTVNILVTLGLLWLVIGGSILFVFWKDMGDDPP